MFLAVQLESGLVVLFVIALVERMAEKQMKKIHESFYAEKMKFSESSCYRLQHLLRIS